MKFSTAIIALLALASAVIAKPGRSPICDTATAKDAFAASPMAPNKRNLAQENAFTFTSDAQTYTPGQKITFTLSGSSEFSGILLYVAPTADPSKRVGKFEIPDVFQNNADVCTNSEFPESSLTHKAGQKYTGPINFVYTAPAADQGELNLNVIIVINADGGGFGWGIWPTAAKIGSGTPSLDSNPGSIYGVTPFPEPLGAVEAHTMCPPPSTATLIRKCKVKTGFQTTISKTLIQMVTVTQTDTAVVTSTCTSTVTSSQICTTTTNGDVLGGQEQPTEYTPMPTPMYDDVLGNNEVPTTPAYDSYNNYNNYY